MQCMVKSYKRHDGIICYGKWRTFFLFLHSFRVPALDSDKKEMSLHWFSKNQ